MSQNNIADKLNRLERIIEVFEKEVLCLKEMIAEKNRKDQASKSGDSLNKTQAAKYLGVSTRTIHRWEAGGRIMFDATGRIHRRKLDNLM